MPSMSIAGAVSGVMTSPGETAFTRIPRDASSRAETWVSIASPALAEQYAASPPPGCRALSEVIDVIEPPSPSTRPACLMTRNAPVRQTSTTRRHSPRSWSTTAARVDVPALLTTTSTRPCAATTPSKSAVTASSEVTSQTTSAPLSVPLARSATTTVHPSSARARAQAAPIPDAPPDHDRDSIRMRSSSDVLDACQVSA